ncbi:tyrosine-type recombinase/integrase [Actinophytocola sp.]|uniref:tyrosine-type recombinase/integrase n=1 Tax=Actinophytocola sp. TaxID=1872138 RepID=UPI002D706B67|nr:tyrosine-type recombinase/integrase [Actinophytocola sp.]HYQ62786.1 tyrosine-type recombinase/integrase [Actinophytocola sp.]
MIERTSAGNAHTQYRSLRTFFGWLVREDEIDINPMDKTTAPIVPEQPVPIVRDDLTGSLLGTCQGRDMISRRDAAIIRLLLDTGCRLGELAALNVDDVDFDLSVINVVGKGRRGRAIPFGAKTAQALARYMRVRAKGSTPGTQSCGCRTATGGRSSRTATRSGSCSPAAPARWGRTCTSGDTRSRTWG